MRSLLLVACILAISFSGSLATGCPYHGRQTEQFGTVGGYHARAFCAIVEMSESRKRPPTDEIEGYVAKQARVEEVKEASGMTMSVPRIGFSAPDFSTQAVLPDKSFGTVTLSSYRDSQTHFSGINTVVLGASVDSVFSHLAWINTPRKQGGLGALDIPLLEDVTKSIATTYGVLHMDSGHTNRGLFIIDPQGILRHITMNDPPVGRNVQEIIRLVEAYQHVDQHGEVCPVNWSKGKPTMKADPTASKTYFEQNA